MYSCRISVVTQLPLQVRKQKPDLIKNSFSRSFNFIVNKKEKYVKLTDYRVSTNSLMTSFLESLATLVVNYTEEIITSQYIIVVGFI